ncbi:hypothetical protein L596_007852 [Steinernema carpocapsae]|uniref:Uncharacterized protein n=1 Tax=Steinernema carpocapsae TaxID=34508 RepID=A0A4V6A657_STECR|nr:hypothetical protein L596_007852 [Steinernema carpocapsae]
MLGERGTIAFWGSSKSDTNRRCLQDMMDSEFERCAHGLPRAFGTKGFRRCLWVILFLGCLVAFSMQAYLIIVRFLRNDIIVGVELKFERIRFPSVSVCNINPYKNSLARNMGSVKDTLNAFDEAIEKSVVHPTAKRKRRSVTSEDWRIVESKCAADMQNLEIYLADESGSEVCLCRQNRNVQLIWDCRPQREWKERFCSKCDEQSGFCEAEATEVQEEQPSPYPCICNSQHCLLSEFKKGSVRLKWPLELSHSLCDCDISEGGYCSVSRSSLRNCQCVGPRNAPSYCAPMERWSEEKCVNCNWWSECDRSWALESIQRCLCDTRNGKCFATEELREESITEKGAIRIRRQTRRVYEKIQTHFDGLLAVYAKCECKGNNCVSIQERRNEEEKETCLCFFNQKNGQLWPCYKPSQWTERKCERCSSMGDCTYSDTGGKLPCVCAPIIRMCVRIDDPKAAEKILESKIANMSAEVNETSLLEAVEGSGDFFLEDRIPKIWEIATTPPPTEITVIEEKEKAFGLTGVSDPIALKAKASENLVFAVSQLDDTEKQSLSYTKTEFITKCSFNGRQCSVETWVSICF